MLPKILLFRGIGVISSFIRWQTRGEYSHAALLRPDGRIIESWMSDGVRIKRPCAGCWDNVTAFDIVGISDKQGHDIIRYAEKQVGMSYDWWGVLRFISRDRLPDAAHRWFCSELVYHSCQMAGVQLFRNTASFEVSPDLLKRSPLLTESDRIS